MEAGLLRGRTSRSPPLGDPVRCPDRPCKRLDPTAGAGSAAEPLGSEQPEWDDGDAVVASVGVVPGRDDHCVEQVVADPAA